ALRMARTHGPHPLATDFGQKVQAHSDLLSPILDLRRRLYNGTSAYRNGVYSEHWRCAAGHVPSSGVNWIPACRSVTTARARPATPWCLAAPRSDRACSWTPG